MFVRLMMGIVPVKITLVEDLATLAKMGTTITQNALVRKWFKSLRSLMMMMILFLKFFIFFLFKTAVAILTELWKRFATKILESVCVRKDLEESDAISAYPTIMVTPIVSRATVARREVRWLPVMLLENVPVCLILPEGFATSAAQATTNTLNVWVSAFT